MLSPKELMEKNGNPCIHNPIGKVPVNKKERRNFIKRLERRKRRSHFRRLAEVNKKVDGSCCICFEKYNNMELNSRKVDLCVCPHHLCRGCFDDIMKNEKSICPECRKPLVSIVDLSVSNVIDEAVYY